VRQDGPRPPAGQPGDRRGDDPTRDARAGDLREVLEGDPGPVPVPATRHDGHGRYGRRPVPAPGPGRAGPGCPGGAPGARRPRTVRGAMDEVRVVTAFHEAGHAVAALSLGRPVAWVSVRPDRQFLGMCAFGKGVFR